MEEVDVELFIAEIRKYPQIWSVSAEEYHDRNKKKDAWINICRVFYDGFDEKEEGVKNEIYNKLMKKWKNTKDTFYKSTKKKLKSGQAAETGKQYIYARQLSFLQPVVTTGNTQDRLTMEEEDESLGERQELQSEPVRRPEKQQTRKRQRDIEASLLEFINTPIPSSVVTAPPELHPDRSFFESLLPFIKDFTEDQKLEFRSEVLNIIKRIRLSTHHASAGYYSRNYNHASATAASAAHFTEMQLRPNSAPLPHQPHGGQNVHPPLYSPSSCSTQSSYFYDI